MAKVNSISIAEIAQVTGFSKTTVSLSLRNHPKIAASTRNLIRTEAERLGYRPNPLVSANMAQIRLRRGSPTTGNLGVVTWGEPDQAPNDLGRLDGVLAGIREQADRQGFALDVFDLSSPGMTARRLTQICQARGIHGLVLLLPAGVPEVPKRLPADWTGFGVINAGAPAIEPRAAWVGHDLMHAVLEGYARLRVAGYREIGMLLDPAFNHWFEHRPAAAFLQAQLEHGVATPRLACLETEANPRWAPWQVQTEAVLVCHPTALQQSLLEGLYPPDARCEIGSESTLKAGTVFASPTHEIGRVAVDTLTQQLFHNERTLPRFPRRIEIPSSQAFRHPVASEAERALAYA